jgi:hypothetical protein
LRESAPEARLESLIACELESLSGAASPRHPRDATHKLTS